MYIVVVPVNKVYAFISSQIVERLLYRQSEFPSEFRNENQGPFYFLSIAIHNTLFVILQQR